MEEVRADHVKVKWEKPEDNGGTEITGYVLEKMDVDTGRWIPAGEVGPDETSFNFTGLTPKKKYKFRVKAVNKEGESEPLEVEEAILARNPYGMITIVFFLIHFILTFAPPQTSLTSLANPSSSTTTTLAYPSSGRSLRTTAVDRSLITRWR